MLAKKYAYYQISVHLLLLVLAELCSLVLQLLDCVPGSVNFITLSLDLEE